MPSRCCPRLQARDLCERARRRSCPGSRTAAPGDTRAASAPPPRAFSEPARSRRPRSARAQGQARGSDCARLRAVRGSPVEAFAPLQPLPAAVAVDDYAAVVKDVREQQHRTLCLVESDELNAAADCALEPLAQFRTRARAVTAQLNEEIEIAVRLLLATRDAAEDDREPHVRLGAEGSEQPFEERPVPADIVVLRRRNDDAALARPLTADRAAGRRATQRATARANLFRERVKLGHRVSNLAGRCVQ